MNNNQTTTVCMIIIICMVTLINHLTKTITSTLGGDESNCGKKANHALAEVPDGVSVVTSSSSRHARKAKGRNDYFYTCTIDFFRHMTLFFDDCLC
jgi:hypothetical protein